MMTCVNGVTRGFGFHGRRALVCLWTGSEFRLELDLSPHFSLHFGKVQYRPETQRRAAHGDTLLESIRRGWTNGRLQASGRFQTQWIFVCFASATRVEILISHRLPARASARSPIQFPHYQPVFIVVPLAGK